MEQLIFFAIIIIFSIIDSVARTRKKRRAGLPEQTSPVPEEWSWEDDDGDVATYDADPSYDDQYRMEQTERGTLSEYTAPSYESNKAPQGSQPKSSEAMIPTDIWEEIAGLARGKPPEPKPAPPPPMEIQPVGARPEMTHRVHLSHAGYGTDPSSRAKSKEDGLDPLKSTLSRDAQAVRRQLKSHSRSQLRRAVILQELLGPPVSMQSERVAD